MNMSVITGGEPAGKTIHVVSEEDAKEIDRLLKKGNRVSVDDVNERVSTRSGRKGKVDAYREYIAELEEKFASGHPRIKSALAKANQGLTRLREKDIAPGTVHQNSTLTNLSIQYANHAYIGEMLMPPLPVTKQSNVYYIYGRGDRMQAPDDSLGPRSQANEIQESRTTDTYLCKPYGLQNFVSAMTLANEDAPLNELVDIVESINELMLFNREKRIAAIMTDTAQYGSGQYTSVAAADRWDTADGGDPIKNIQEAHAEVWPGYGPSRMVAFSSLKVYQVLSRHPAILDLFKYNGSSPGLATPSMIMKFFEIDEYHIGRARKDTATEGDADVYARIWTDVFGIVRVADRPSIRNAVFGYTIRHNQPITLQWFDQRLGHGGGYFAKVSVSEVHKVTAAATGYLINTPIG